MLHFVNLLDGWSTFQCVTILSVVYIALVLCSPSLNFACTRMYAIPTSSNSRTDDRDIWAVSRP